MTLACGLWDTDARGSAVPLEVGRVPDGSTSSASAMAEARAEFRRGDRRVDVGYLLGFVPGGGRAGSGTWGFLSVSMTVAESVGTRLRGEIGGLRRDGSRGGSVGDRTEPSWLSDYRTMSRLYMLI
jgi:hypothetical protein